MADLISSFADISNCSSLSNITRLCDPHLPHSAAATMATVRPPLHKEDHRSCDNTRLRTLAPTHMHARTQLIRLRMNCIMAHFLKRKKKVVFLYSAVSSPSDRSKHFTLFASPGRPVHSDTNSASPGSILARQQLRATTKSLTCPPLSMARYSFIQLLSQQWRQWRERKCPIFDTLAKQDSNPGSLDCEYGILPLSYRAARVCNKLCQRAILIIHAKECSS